MSKHANRHWEVNSDNKDIHELHFTEFYDDEIIATLVPGDDEDPTFWNYHLNFDGYTDTFITADSLEEAEEQVEDAVVEYWEDEISRLNECIDKFKEEL